VAQTATAAFKTFKRCQCHNVVKSCQFGEKLRKNKEALGKLVSYKREITTRRIRRSTEMIDICDFAVGLSRQLPD
jgi:aldehyde dehydrogenase (NAD+)